MKLQYKFLTLVSFILLFSLVLTNCHSTKEVSKTETTPKTNTGENFDKFYDKFHQDSLFQVSRTKFPLGGMSVEGENKTKWTKDNLPLMKTRIYDVDTTQYKVSFKKTETTFTEKVWLEDSGFIFECRFDLINKKWYLVYVLDQNF